MIYCFDIDGTICSLVENSNYKEAIPFDNMLKKINELYDEGHKIYFMTARGSVSGKDWTRFTKNQLDCWGFKYHKLITNQKPHAHYFIDDKAHNAHQWSKANTQAIRGVIAGSFDVIHPGYVKMFEQAKNYCNHLTICLHDNPNKSLKTILTLRERKEILQSIKYIDDIEIYQTEKDLDNILMKKNFDVRILGDDYVACKVTGANRCKKTVFINRDHGWSTTKFKKMISDSFQESK